LRAKTFPLKSYSNQQPTERGNNLKGDVLNDTYCKKSVCR
jgi:hypothetical protein